MFTAPVITLEKVEQLKPQSAALMSAAFGDEYEAKFHDMGNICVLHHAAEWLYVSYSYEPEISAN